MVARDKRRRARPPAPADARAPGSCSRPCSSCSRLWPRPLPRGPAAAGRVRVRRARAVSRRLRASCAGPAFRRGVGASKPSRTRASSCGRGASQRRPPPDARCGAGPPESAGRRLTRRVHAGDGVLMRLCRSFRRRRVRPNRARLRRWVLQWCLLVACKPTHGRSQGKIQS